MECLKQQGSINWDMWSALAMLAQTIFLYIPAAGYFLKRMLNYANFWVFDQTTNGIRIAIHNKSKSSLFILEKEICVKNSQSSHTHCLPAPPNCAVSQMCIKPDDIVYIDIDYTIYQITPSDQIILYIRFGGKHFRRKKKIKRG